MKLTKLKLSNFRCFGSAETVISFDDITTFIGNNSSGKTAVLSALNCLLNTRTVSKSDFHVPLGETLQHLRRQDLFIEAVFTFPELAADNPSCPAIAQFFESFVVSEQGGDPYMRLRLSAIWEDSCEAEGSITLDLSYIKCAEQVEITDESKIRARAADLSRIRFVYIPAIRDTAKQLVNSQSSLMSRLLSGINWSQATKDTIAEKSSELNDLFLNECGTKMVVQAIDDTWKKFDFDTRFSNAKLSFSANDIETAMRKSEVRFFPNEEGRDSSIQEVGDGLKSLFYISLASSILKLENAISQLPESEDAPFSRHVPILTILAVEEPENHIAPHVLGRTVDGLVKVADEANAQVLLTTHSPAIVRRIDPKSIRYLNFNHTKGRATIRALTLPNAEQPQSRYKYIKEAITKYPELYFASLVILGEGESEEIVIPKILKAKIGKTVDIAGISVVPLGGRHVNHLWRLLSDLEIPYLTLLDLDLGRHGGGWGRIAYVIEQLTENGINVEDIMPEGETSIDDMFHWSPADQPRMRKWISKLETFGIIFSSPLDLDFMMLSQCPDKYKNILTDREGPHEETIRQTEQGTKIALKSESADISLYDTAQQALMPWYNYFFLTRGKPVSHLEALSGLTDDEITAITPAPLATLAASTQQLLQSQDECD